MDLPYYYLTSHMGSYTVEVAGLTVNQILSGSGGSTPSLPIYR